MTSSTSSRLAYLDRIGLVCPEKIGEGHGCKPVVLYTEQQCDDIRLINQASKYFHLDAIRFAIKTKKLQAAVDALSAIF